jgi:hypothetical protein
LIFLLIPVLSYGRTKQEVQQLIVEVEDTYNGLAHNIEIYAAPEKKIIKSKIDLAKDFLSKKEYDDAYTEISLCKHYFILINARKELYNARKEYANANKKYSP